MAEFDYEVVNGRKIRVRPQEVVSEIDENGYFVRQPNHFTEGFGEGKNPVEKGRYHLVWAKLCHWSNRASIVRELLGLEDAISVNMVDHAKHEKNLGWEFVYDKDHIDPVLGIQFLSEAYYKADDDYTGRTTVPALINTKTGSASKDSSSDSEKTVIKAATGANAKPYVYVGDDDKPAGYDVDVLNAVFDKLPDYELEYEVTDFGSVLSGLNSGNYQIGVNNFSYNEDRGASYLYSYPYDKISYVFVTKKGGKEIKSFEDAAGLSFEGGTGISVSNAVEAWNEKNPDKAINITYSDADTSVFLQHVADGSQDFTIIDLAMYNSYMEEFNYDVQKNDIPEDEAKMIAENSYAYYIFPQDQKDLREQVDKALKELKEDGTLTEISKKWYGQDTAPEDDKFEETIN